MTKIEWCDEVWNPVWGCHNKCPYCYAKSIAKRFGKTNDEINFIPHWKEANFNRKFAKSTKRVFVNSMSDIMYWQKEWMERVIDRIKELPNIQFIFLTKGGYKAYAGYEFPDNVVCGITVTKPSEFPIKTPGRFFPARYWLLNIEPMLEPFNSGYVADNANDFDWIIIGAETGNRKDKPIPELWWFEWFLKVPYFKLFIKPSLDRFIPANRIRREFIELDQTDIFRSDND
jgi:protein gp37